MLPYWLDPVVLLQFVRTVRHDGNTTLHDGLVTIGANATPVEGRGGAGESEVSEKGGSEWVMSCSDGDGGRLYHRFLLYMLLFVMMHP